MFDAPVSLGREFANRLQARGHCQRRLSPLGGVASGGGRLDKLMIMGYQYRIN